MAPKCFVFKVIYLYIIQSFAFVRKNNPILIIIFVIYINKYPPYTPAKFLYFHGMVNDSGTPRKLNIPFTALYIP